jgi:predicted transglutaminase-like cysteine proteinase
MALAAFGLLLAMTPSAASSPSLFGTVEFRAESLAALPQWLRVLRQVEAERGVYEACRRTPETCPSRHVLEWQEMRRAHADRPPIEQVRAVNRYLNGWRYRSDQENYGVRDYWATPLEFFERSGDCEDYAITKYVTLRKLGFPAERLRLVVVHDLRRDLAHAVLAVYLNGEVHLMDNLSMAVLPQERVTHYVPYYSVNETTRWAHVPPIEAVAQRHDDRLLPSSPAQRAPAR